MGNFSSNEKPVSGSHTYTLPKSLAEDHWAYEGLWTLNDESGLAQKSAALEFQFVADKVYLVMGPSKSGGHVAVLLDGKPAESYAGEDVKNGSIHLDSERLYRLIDLKGKPGAHRLRLEFLDDGIAVYPFTFG
jgi:hypothetical protein